MRVRASPAELLFGLYLLFSLLLRLWYAGWGLDNIRFYDERFSFENVRAVLEAGALEPANGYYPTLSYLPQTLLLAASDRLHRETGLEAFDIYRDSGGFGPTAYRISRYVQVFYGVLSLWLLFLLGRKVFSPEVGMLAAVLLGSTAWHVHASAYFKPDILLMTTVLLALHLSLRAIEKPTLGRYAWAGVGVALALGSKLTGGVVALPLTAATLARGWRLGGAWARLVLAGALSLALYLLMNPHLKLYLHFMGRLSREYAGSAQALGENRWTMLRETLAWLGGGETFSLASLLIPLGLGLFALGLRRVGLEGREGRYLLMLLLFPFLYTALYFAATPHFKKNNLLPILPLLALAIAFAAVWLWRRLEERWPAARGRPTRALALALGGLWMLAVPFLFAYRSLVPTTEDMALRFLNHRLKDQSPRVVFAEAAAAAADEAWEGRRRLSRRVGIRRVASLDGLDEAEHDLADGEIGLADRPVEAGGFGERLERFAESRTATVRPRLFRARGPALTALATPWRSIAAEYVGIAPAHGRPARLRSALFTTPARGGRESYSLAVFVAASILERSGEIPRLELDGRELELHWVQGVKGTQLMTTLRFAPERGPRRAELAFAAPLGPRPEVQLAWNYWRRGR